MFGYTPLAFACMQNQGHNSQSLRYNCINSLIKYNVSCNHLNYRTKWSPIHWISYYGDLKSLRLLLANGAISVLPDYEGLLPMDLAASFKHT